MKRGLTVLLIACGLLDHLQSNAQLQRKSLPLLDLSADSSRHVIIARGTSDVYNGSGLDFCSDYLYQIPAGAGKALRSEYPL